MAGETVVLDMKSGMYYGMDGVGGLIWNLLEQPQTLEAIHAAVLAEYEVDPASCERDVAAFISALQSAGLIEVTHENAA